MALDFLHSRPTSPPRFYAFEELQRLPVSPMVLGFPPYQGRAYYMLVRMFLAFCDLMWRIDIHALHDLILSFFFSIHCTLVHCSFSVFTTPILFYFSFFTVFVSGFVFICLFYATGFTLPFPLGRTRFPASFYLRSPSGYVLVSLTHRLCILSSW